MKLTRTKLKRLILNELRLINESQEYDSLSSEDKACAMIGYIEKYIRSLPTSKRMEQEEKLGDLVDALLGARDGSPFKPEARYSGVIEKTTAGLRDAGAVEDLGGMEGLVSIGKRMTKTNTKRGYSG